MVEYIDTTFLVPHKYAIKYLKNVYEDSKRLIENFMKKIKTFNNILEISQFIVDQIKSINIYVKII